MALSDPRSAFGIHAIVMYNRANYIPYGVVRVLGGGEVSLEGDRVDLLGGSNPFPWQSVISRIESEFTFTAREYPDFLMELFNGAIVTTTAAEASGSVTGLTNVEGTSVFDATTGVASAAITTASDAKFGRYVLLANDQGDEVDVYLQSIIDVKKGTELVLQDDTLKITASALTIPGTGGTVLIPDTGVTLTGGSGAISLTEDDTAYFDVLPIHDGRSNIKVGALGTSFPDFGARMTAQKIGDGRIFEVHAWKANGSGMPIGLTEVEFAEPELSMKLLYDSVQDAVFEIEAVKGQ